MTPVLELRDLCVGYHDGGRRIVVADGLQAALPTRRMVALVGRNGCGKSTLLRTLAGLQPALGGAVLLDGKPLSALSAQAIARRIGVVLTERPALRHTTVRELVRYGRIPYANLVGTLSVTDEQAVDAALALTHATSLADRYLYTLSDGERARAFVAKTVAQATDILLLDEPTAFLDFPAKTELMNLLCDLAHDGGKTIVFSSHDIDLAARAADSFWHLRNGQLAEVAAAPMTADEI